MKEAKIIKRLCIYFFYDAQGIVDRYVLHMLAAMRPHCEELAVVSNASLELASEQAIQKIVDIVIQRENVGFDVWAYKFMLERYGWERLSEFDEVILMNHTIMGPVYSLNEVFLKMEQMEVDFWGLTTYHELSYDPFGKCKLGYIPLHLQSHFIVLRRNLIMSDALHDYWASIPPIRSYEEAICFHEAIFTKTFADLGFRWASYVDTTDMTMHNAYPLIYTPVRLIREKHCPIFKRRSFFHNYDDLCTHSLGEQGHALMEYLESETQYDTDMIWENILRTCNFEAIQKCLGLYYVLPLHNVISTSQPQRIALVMHLYYEERFDYCYHYALSMPSTADIYITTATEEKRQVLRQLFSHGPWQHVEVRVIENRGRDISALLVGCRDVASWYDLVCFAHDKKSHRGEMEILGENFSEHCFWNILGSKEYVGNVLGLFQSQPRLGLLCPPPPYHGSYADFIGEEWTNNYENVRELAQQLDIKVPFESAYEPIAPLGTMFWFRPAALTALFEAGWSYADFPAEPNALDGTFLHAVERLYPLAAQQAGYYSAWATTDRYAARYMLTIRHILRRERKTLFNDVRALLRLSLKRVLKSGIPPSIWNATKKVYHSISGKKRVR